MKNNNVKGFTNKAIINQEAAQWILFLEDTPKLSKQQIKALNDWVATSEVHKECLESMATSWNEMDLLSSVMLAQEIQKQPWLSSMIKTVSQALIKTVLACANQGRKILQIKVLTPLALCAFLSVTVLHQPPAEPTLTQLTTSVGENLTHTMPDGSVLWLNSSTEIELNYSSKYRRINLVKGEAHFEVAKDPNRPFEVYAGDRLVKAIGTAFSVHKLDQSIEVLVTEGTVELAIIDNSLVVTPDELKNSGSQNSSVLRLDSTKLKLAHTMGPAKVKKVLHKLTAGQRVSIPVQAEDLGNIAELDVSEMTRFLSWKEGKLVFAGESLEEVVREITRHTEVEIELVDPKLKSIRIGGQFQVGETDSLFYVLESGFGIGVNKLDERHVELYLKE